MTYVDKLLLIACVFQNTFVSGEWVQLPKLSRQEKPVIRVISKESEPKPTVTTSTTTSTPIISTTPNMTRGPITTPSTIFMENEFLVEDNYGFDFTNQSYTSFLDPKLNSVFIKAHQVLVEEAKHPMKHKLRFLKRLQNNILNQIWSRSQLLWTSDNLEGRGHGHMMSFPSLEGALMTISFLTFAVFLIKIVKQFLQGLQGANYYNNMIGIEFPVTPTPAKVIKHKREANFYDTTHLDHILNYIDELKGTPEMRLMNHRPYY